MKIIIFAEDRLHSAIRKQAFIALVCTIFAEDRLHSAIRKQEAVASAHIFIIGKADGTARQSHGCRIAAQNREKEEPQT